MEWEDAFEILDSILPGETVLLEYTPSYIPEFVLKAFVEYSKERKVPLLIDDDFDTLHTIATRARFLGVEMDLSGAKVIKTGGKEEEVGNVVARVAFHPDAGVYIRNYEEAGRRVLGDAQYPMLNLVLGIENLFLFMRSSLNSYQLILSIQRFLGNRRRKAFYLVNREALETLSSGVLEELERISTTVIKMNPYPTGARGNVKKSVNPSLTGKKFDIAVRGLGA
ncbi:DUF257 family protein [Thermococcus sp.]|uniref:DUF257 family protein n=1 Tax=Thermococcus sp. TaxID=35749 RepID=UPI0026217BDD|nr:DUF257 family protein [Thermococcus sp.]